MRMGCFVAALLALYCGDVMAWGNEGHRLIADIAEHYLTPVAQRKIQTLLKAEKRYGVVKCPVKTLADAATWPDCLRSFGKTHEATYPWHYDDIPLCGEAEHGAYCPNGQCLSTQTERLIGVLSDKNAMVKDRLEALKFVAHFIGDAHQPLHASDNHDRGGNAIRANFFGDHAPTLNLHHIWDTEIVQRLIGDNPDAAGEYALQIDDADVQAWSHGTLGEWLAESHQVARDLVYPSLPTPPACGVVPGETEVLGNAYYDAVKDTVEQQLKKAGVRLAKVLNDALR